MRRPFESARSAEREFERRKAVREERIKSRFGRVLGGAILAVTSEPQTTKVWASGADGERRVAEALSGETDVVVLNDRRVPGTRGNIDHIVVGPPGVFVVDAKDHRGLVHIVDRGGLWYRCQRWADAHKRAAESASAHTVSSAVSSSAAVGARS